MGSGPSDPRSTYRSVWSQNQSSTSHVVNNKCTKSRLIFRTCRTRAAVVLLLTDKPQTYQSKTKTTGQIGTVTGPWSRMRWIQRLTWLIMCIGVVNMLKFFGVETLSHFLDKAERVDTCVKTKIALLYKKQWIILERHASAFYWIASKWPGILSPKRLSMFNTPMPITDCFNI